MAATANKRIPHRAGLLAACIALGCASGAHALDWTVSPSVGVSATYTDNARQSASNPEDALILGVSPSVSLTSKGSRRVQATLQYGLNGVLRIGDDESDSLYHNLNALGRAELVEDFLFIEGNARVSQELVSLLGSPAGADVNDSNRATVGTYSVSPYVQKRFGTFANAQARYTASGAIFENQASADAASNAFSAGLTSGTRFDDLSWGVNYSIRRTENRDASIATYNTSTTFERASLSLGYALTRKFRVFGVYGHDWNDYLSTTQTDGSFYNVGIGWAPSRRTSLEVSAGERYFGSTFGVTASHRTRMSRWTLRYYEDVSDITQQFLEQSARVFWLCNGTLVETPDVVNPDPVACQGPITAGQLALAYQSLGVSLNDLIAAGLLNIGSANGIFLIKGLTAGVSWDVGRLGFGLSAQDTRRLYQLFGDAEDHVQGLTGTVRYRMSPHTTASGSLSLTRTRVDSALNAGAARADDLLSFSLGLNHSFAEKLTGALTFRHTERDSNVATGDYTENSLTASVNMRF